MSTGLICDNKTHQLHCFGDLKRFVSSRKDFPVWMAVVKNEKIPEEDLLFGLIALRLGLISQLQLQNAFQVLCESKQQREVATELVDQGYITEHAKLNLARIVKDQISCHGGDKKKSLEILNVRQPTVQALLENTD